MFNFYVNSIKNILKIVYLNLKLIIVLLDVYFTKYRGGGR